MEWISVKDQMPEIPDIKLWCNIIPRESYYFRVPGYEGVTTMANFAPYQTIVKTYLTKNGEIRFNCGCLEEVTHWAELPDHPML
ncbi:DUF551 domain-containing protein [Patescibacteria group bacterium]|nr:DUF551 domain-containing protein [Patescibacteria group bacterium]